MSLSLLHLRQHLRFHRSFSFFLGLKHQSIIFIYIINRSLIQIKVASEESITKGTEGFLLKIEKRVEVGVEVEVEEAEYLYLHQNENQVQQTIQTNLQKSYGFIYHYEPQQLYTLVYLQHSYHILKFFSSFQAFNVLALQGSLPAFLFILFSCSP